MSCVAAAFACGGVPLTLAAQNAVSRSATQPPASSIDSLVHLALSHSYPLRAALEQVNAARARVATAGRFPEPMLMAGLQNLPTKGGFTDEMTMKMVGVTQSLPARGRRDAAQRVAGQELAVAAADAEVIRWTARREVLVAYHELAYLDRAIEIALRTRDLLVNIEQVAQSQYAVGGGRQADVLRVRNDAAGVALEAVALREERSATLARLNALLDRPSTSAVNDVRTPPRIERLALPDSAQPVRYASATLGARLARSPIPALDSLQALALRHNPSLLASDARIAVQSQRVTLTRLEQRPDVDVALQYGQREGRPDMLSAVVSVPLRRRRIASEIVSAESAVERAFTLDHHALRTSLLANVARLAAELERSRTQLSITTRTILPQSRAVTDAMFAAYRNGSGSLAEVLETQAALFEAETTFHRTLAEFARALAELEQLCGVEIES